jgi:hypothetical protein
MLSDLTAGAPAGSPSSGPPTAVPAVDPYGDSQAILERVRKFREEFGKRELRDRFLRPMYRNLLFYRGIQWIKWDLGTGRWRPANIPRGVPTPVTNIFADTMDTVNSVFGRVEPTLTWRPSTEEAEDRAAADVAARAIQVIEGEVKLRMVRQSLATWVGFTGGAFLESGYDPDPVWGMRTVPLEACPGCQHQQPPGAPQCEQCGQPGPLLPTEQSVPRGKMYAEVAPLFEMFFDPTITQAGQHRRLLREKCLSVDDAKTRWKDISEQIAANVAGSADESYMSALAIQGPALDERGTGRRDQALSGLLGNNRVTERWYWQLPDDTYPEGLLAIVVGESALAYAKPLPYWAQSQDGGKRYFLPFTWFPQKLVPGTFWPKTVADDIALKQSDRNRWESALMLCGMRMGMPIWLEPREANVQGLMDGGGEAGARVKYNALGPGNAKPERVPGQPLPMSFVEWIHNIDSAVEKLAKTFDVLKGGRPAGVSAGIALQILQERGLSSYGPLFIMWEDAWAEWASQAIEIFRLYATEERLRRIKGRDGSWEVEKFIGADLQGNVDVIAEAGSSTPRSTLADRAEVEQLMAYHVLNPLDPETAGKILDLYGKSTWLPSLTLDTKNAIIEDEAFATIAALPIWQRATPQDVAAIEQATTYPEAVALMEQWQQTVGLQLPVPWPKVYPGLDGHAAHSREHGNFGKSESFRQFAPIIQAMVEKHKAYHDQLLIQQQAALQSGQGVQPRGGFMQPASGPQEGPQPMNGASSPQRMAGDYHELQADVASGGA